MNDFVRISKHIFPTIIAVSEKEQEKGLMGVEWPPPVMSFVYSSPKFNSFWMKNTPSPLDIVFCLDGKVHSIHSGEPHSTKIIGGNFLSDLVIELPGGTCASLDIKSGDEVEMSFCAESLLKIFSRRVAIRQK